VILSEGVYLSMLVSEMHHSMEIWGKDADEFRPERFATNNKRHPYSFVPFSGGPRTCLGSQFAPMMIKIGLAHLLRTYEFSTQLNIGELKWSGGQIQQLMNKHLVLATKRKWSKK
jgi:cytochrome P450